MSPCQRAAKKRRYYKFIIRLEKQLRKHDDPSSYFLSSSRSTAKRPIIFRSRGIKKIAASYLLANRNATYRHVYQAISLQGASFKILLRKIRRYGIPILCFIAQQKRLLSWIYYPSARRWKTCLENGSGRVRERETTCAKPWRTFRRFQVTAHPYIRLNYLASRHTVRRRPVSRAIRALHANRSTRFTRAARDTKLPACGND